MARQSASRCGVDDGDPDAPDAHLVNHDAQRWTIEPSFRDIKDLHFGK